jgi:hypothetical protein
LLILAGQFIQATEQQIYDQAYRILDQVCERKKEQLTQYLNLVYAKAKSIAADPFMHEFFLAKNDYFHMQKNKTPAPEMTALIENAKNTLQEYYMQKYALFYDILFINHAGDVFYTIRKQNDYHKNVFQGEFNRTKLAKWLKKDTKELFVDYSYYVFSGEPSAFIIVPVMENEKHLGWFALQCLINKINNMFAAEEELGVTGEVFLVNKEQYMLTDSRFCSGTAILKQHLSAENIAAKFKEKQGRKMVIDYRGYRTLTSFEVFPLQNCQWLLIAKIDEDEVLSDYYKKNKSVLKNSLWQQCLRQKAIFNPPQTIAKKRREVNMDEFKQSCAGEVLFTHGVSACTAVIISLPGEFSYMAHISPYDKIYGQTQTDLISHMLKRLFRFDVYEYKKRDLRVTIVAAHDHSLERLIEKLIGHSFFLSQIKFMHCQKANYANIFHDCKNNQTLVMWKQRAAAENTLYHYAADTPNLGVLLKRILNN